MNTRHFLLVSFYVSDCYVSAPGCVVSSCFLGTSLLFCIFVSGMCTVCLCFWQWFVLKFSFFFFTHSQRTGFLMMSLPIASPHGDIMFWSSFAADSAWPHSSCLSGLCFQPLGRSFQTKHWERTEKQGSKIMENVLLLTNEPKHGIFVDASNSALFSVAGVAGEALN